MIHLGYTGTRRGMTPGQKLAVRQLVSLAIDTDELTGHHGDCEGGDAEFHSIMIEMRSIAGPRVRIVIHPPIDNTHRAFCRDADEMRAPLTHFARNRAIVDESLALIAAPYEQERQPRGGTWYTFDYAIKRGRTVAQLIRTVFDPVDQPCMISYAHAMSVADTWPTRRVQP